MTKMFSAGTVSGILLVLLLASMFTPAFNVRARADQENGGLSVDSGPVARAKSGSDATVFPVSYEIGGQGGDITAGQILSDSIPGQPILEYWLNLSSAVRAPGVLNPDQAVEYSGFCPYEQVKAPEPIQLVLADSPVRPVVSIPQSPGTITIKGRMVYLNEKGGYSPMRQVWVVLMDEDVGPDETVASQYTDYNGYFSFTVNNDDGFLQGGRDPYVNVYAENGAAYCKTGGLIASSYICELPKCGNDVPDGFTYDYGTLVPVSYNEAWQAIDACLSERDWVYWRTSPNWQRTYKVEVRWPFQDWPHSHGDDIHLPDKSTAYWNHATVEHEYGHCIMYALYGDWPSGEGPDPHYVFSESSGGFAMMEGWAEFMQCIVDGNPNNLKDWDNGHGGNIETNDWYNCINTGDMDGNIIEGSVASIFWDICDPKNITDRDYLFMTFSSVFGIMRDYKPGDMLSFWSHWIARYPDVATSAGPLSTIYWHYGIDEDWYAPWGSITINSGATYTNSRWVTLTLDGEDWGSGVYYFRFSEDMGVTWGLWHIYSASPTYWSFYLSTAGDGVKWVEVQFADILWRHMSGSPLIYDGIKLDTTAPTGSIVINQGNPTYTETTSVTLYLTYYDATSGVYKVRYSNDGVWDTEPWYDVTATKAWNLTAGDGTKTVYYQIKDNVGLLSQTYSDTIIKQTTTFSSGFESGSFSGWTGKSSSAGGTATVVSTLQHDDTYSARFTSNGTGGTEYAYCYKTMTSSSEFYARAYFYVSQSGIVDDGDCFYFIILGASSDVAYAGWRKTGGVVKWVLVVKNGTSSVFAYSSGSPSLNRWYCVELHWKKSGTAGLGELIVNSVRACSLKGLNTAAYGNVTKVRFGLAAIYYCGATKVYCDCVKVDRSYVGQEALFSDGFESGSFSGWTTTMSSWGETATVTSSIAHHGRYSAKFTSNGGGGFEYSSCVEVITPLTEIYSRGYFRVAVSGIVDDGDSITFLAFANDSGAYPAYAGWCKTGGVVKWFLLVGSTIVYSTASPSLNTWYCVELHWKQGVTNGFGELYVNGVKLCTITGKNTLTYDTVSQAIFGLGVLNCASTTVYCDCTEIATNYIGTEY